MENIIITDKVLQVTNKATCDEIIKTALKKMEKKKQFLNSKSVYCMRVLVGRKPKSLENAELAAVLIGDCITETPKILLALWREIEESGTAKALKESMNPGSYTAGPGVLLFGQEGML